MQLAFRLNFHWHDLNLLGGFWFNDKKINMSKATFVAIFIFIFITAAEAQRPIPVYDFDGFAPFLDQQNDTTYVINFWATWCKPCVEELPAFEALNKNFKKEKVKVILVSLDFIRHYDTKLLPFVEDRGIESKVLLLNDPKSSQWIDRVSAEWSGAIPATVIYRGDMRHFYEQSFTYDALESEVGKYMKP